MWAWTRAQTGSGGDAARATCDDGSRGRRRHAFAEWQWRRGADRRLTVGDGGDGRRRKSVVMEEEGEGRWSEGDVGRQKQTGGEEVRAIGSGQDDD